MKTYHDLEDQSIRIHGKRFNLRKKGKLNTSHRYDLLPLLHSYPGGIRRELVVYDFPRGKVTNNLQNYKRVYNKETAEAV